MNDLVWLVVGQRPQQDSVNHAKDSGGCANAQRQREYGDKREASILPQYPQRIAQIVKHRFHRLLPQSFTPASRRNEVIGRSHPHRSRFSGGGKDLSRQTPVTSNELRRQDPSRSDTRLIRRSTLTTKEYHPAIPSKSVHSRNRMPEIGHGRDVFGP